MPPPSIRRSPQAETGLRASDRFLPLGRKETESFAGCCLSSRAAAAAEGRGVCRHRPPSSRPPARTRRGATTRRCGPYACARLGGTRFMSRSFARCASRESCPRAGISRESPLVYNLVKILKPRARAGISRAFARDFRLHTGFFWPAHRAKTGNKFFGLGAMLHDPDPDSQRYDTEI